MPRVTYVATRTGAQRRLGTLQPSFSPANASQPGSSSNASASTSTSTPDPFLRFYCPYCTMWTTNESGRTRHILNTPACSAAQARDVALARVAREEARRLGIRLPLRTGVTWDDLGDEGEGEGEGEHGIPLVRTDPPTEDAIFTGATNTDPAHTQAHASGSGPGAPNSPPAGDEAVPEYTTPEPHANEEVRSADGNDGISKTQFGYIALYI